MSRAKNRPRRGSPGSSVLIEGDTGIFPGPLGGAEPGATESGDLASREYGVPQADIPGGVRHLVNPQTRHARPPGVPERPADYHKEHGVEPLDDGQYALPPDATEERPSKGIPEPRTHNAIPVYIVSEEPAGKSRRVAVTDTIALPAVGTDPARICNLDDARDEVMLLCTDGTHDALFSDDRSSLAIATATDHGRCAFLSHSATSYTRVATQGELWGTSADASISHLAIVYITSVASG